MEKKVAVLLCGGGHKDGTEITEAVAALISLSQCAIPADCFAPDQDFAALNFLTDQTLSEKRNTLVESARIARSKVQDWKNLNPLQYDALVLPGGTGLLTLMTEWPSMQHRSPLNPQLESLIQSFHQQSKPIGAICISPLLVALALKQKGVTITLGEKNPWPEAIKAMGHHYENCPTDDFITDRLHKIISTPAYMNIDANPGLVFKGVQRMIKELAEMA